MQGDNDALFIEFIDISSRFAHNRRYGIYGPINRYFRSLVQ